jgi:hypothetical protein
MSTVLRWGGKRLRCASATWLRAQIIGNPQRVVPARLDGLRSCHFAAREDPERTRTGIFGSHVAQARLSWVFRSQTWPRMWAPLHAITRENLPGQFKLLKRKDR